MSHSSEMHSVLVFWVANPCGRLGRYRRFVRIRCLLQVHTSLPPRGQTSGRSSARRGLEGDRLVVISECKRFYYDVQVTEGLTSDVGVSASSRGVRCVPGGGSRRRGAGDHAPSAV
ncbi:hypothetical protein L798_02596 [Zootermopsis nevadensis]|uniref:Uncharacterized protein n=1 Tax=Zootermopsis nevadensis TaxID=136037 RepID=A0A067QGM1_ZOONE|nr:hypothetical protein L798_02596 [Zootermopsis nevadensis]